MDIELDPQAVKSGFDAVKSVIDAFKSLRDFYRSRPEARDEVAKIDERLKLAEREVLLAEAQLAQALGYKLCRAHFPPVPMLKDRMHPKYVQEIAKCPECGAEDPTPEYFARKERVDHSVEEHNARMAKQYRW